MQTIPKLLKIVANLRNRFPSPYTIKDAKSWTNLVQKQKPECNFTISSQTEAIGCIGLEFQKDVHYRWGTRVLAK